jgi:hypothetical protein
MEPDELKFMEELNDMESKRANQRISAMQDEQDGLCIESRALGVLQKINYDDTHNKLLKYATLLTIKNEKEYRKIGMTWAEFCDSIGDCARNVDRILKDIKPLYDKFLDQTSILLGMPFNKIRYLGRSVSDKVVKTDGDSLVVDGVKISLIPENKDEIEALLDNLKETHQREKESLESEIKKIKKNQDNIIKEETENLMLEREALLKENRRLKPFDHEKRNSDWCAEQMAEIKSLADKFIFACGHFVIDKRLKDDVEAIARIEGMQDTCMKMLMLLRDNWNQIFNDHDIA